MDDLLKGRVLVIIALALCVLVVVLGVIDAPDLNPVGLVYEQANENRQYSPNLVAPDSDNAAAQDAVSTPQGYSNGGEATASVLFDSGDSSSASKTNTNTSANTTTRTTAAVTAAPGSAAQKPADTPQGKININSATRQELMQLKGIGEVKAQAIIDYRQTSGAFVTIEEIMQVSGIGEKTFENIKSLITV